MKKLIKIGSTVLAGLMMLSSVFALSVSATGKKVSAPSVTVKNTKKGIKISWEKAKGAKNYSVLRKLSTDKKYSTIKTVKKASAGSFTDKKAKAGKKYSYKVKAVNGKDSATSKAKTLIRLESPVIEDASGYEGITIKWDEVAGAKKYEIYRADITTSELGEYVMNFKYADTFTLGDEDDEDRYYTKEESNVFAAFKVRAINGDTKGPFSNVIRVSYIATPDFGVWLREDTSSVDVNFDPVEGACGYRIYRRSQSGKYRLVVDISASELAKYENATTFHSYTYVDTSYPTDGQDYYYAMEAYTDRFSVKIPQSVY